MKIEIPGNPDTNGAADCRHCPLNSQGECGGNPEECPGAGEYELVTIGFIEDYREMESDLIMRDAQLAHGDDVIEDLRKEIEETDRYKDVVGACHKMVKACDCGGRYNGISLATAGPDETYGCEKCFAARAALAALKVKP